MKKKRPAGVLVSTPPVMLWKCTSGLQFVNQIHQSFHAAPEPSSSRPKGIGLAQVGQRLLPRTFDLRAAKFIGEDALASCLLSASSCSSRFWSRVAPGRIQSALVEFSLRRQILDTHVEDEETRRTNRERFSNLKAAFFEHLRHTADPAILGKTGKLSRGHSPALPLRARLKRCLERSTA